uniref:Uncharacterized protein n=1 Tax=Dulem virus 75 TaxID=3145786 RepID=A0AAU8B0R6_9VIRU
MPLNVYARHFPTHCFNCVCHYCTHIHCPYGRLPFKRDLEWCAESTRRRACPRLTCDSFVNRNCTPRRYIIVNRKKKETPALRVLNELAQRIGELEKAIWKTHPNNQTK